MSDSRHWDRVAGGWAAWHDWTARNFAPVTTWLRESGAWRPGAHILDTVCGAGYPSLIAAREVGPSGRVTAIDISSQMLAVARARATGLDITFRQMDAEDLAFDDGAFDSVISTYGLMFCADPVRALCEMRRVLASGGGATIVVWDDPARSPFFHVIAEAGERWLGVAAPATGSPGPFALAPAGRLESLAAEAGFSDIHTDTVEMTLELESPDAYMQVFADVAWKARVEALSDAARAQFRDAVATAAQPYVDEGRVRLPAVSRCLRARRS